MKTTTTTNPPTPAQDGRIETRYRTRLFGRWKNWHIDPLSSSHDSLRSATAEVREWAKTYGADHPDAVQHRFRGTIINRGGEASK